MELKKMKLKELKKLALELDSIVNGACPCYSLKDAILLSQTTRELDRRGIDYGYSLQIGGE
jgi:hypothetical protein